jgi:hypothetical protein
VRLGTNRVPAEYDTIATTKWKLASAQAIYAVFIRKMDFLLCARIDLAMIDMLTQSFFRVLSVNSILLMAPLAALL